MAKLVSQYFKWASLQWFKNMVRSRAVYHPCTIGKQFKLKMSPDFKFLKINKRLLQCFMENCKAFHYFLHRPTLGFYGVFLLSNLQNFNWMIKLIKTQLKFFQMAKWPCFYNFVVIYNLLKSNPMVIFVIVSLITKIWVAKGEK